MKILHTIGSVWRESGGPARSVQGLVSALDRVPGIEAWLLSYKSGEIAWLDGVNRFLAAEQPGFRGALRAVESAIRSIRPDIIHIHGIWAPSSHAAVVCARKQNIPYVIAPRGMLEPWSLNAKKWKKWLAMRLYQRRDLQHAAFLHATAESEAEHFRNLGFIQPVVVIPNGVNLPHALPAKSLYMEGRRRVLFISRIHPKKGLVELIHAWALIRPSDWVLEIVGPDTDGYQKVIEQAVADQGVQSSVIFTGPLEDEKKWEAYCRADLFVLPTFSENFGIVVAEALYAGVPVITTKGTPWSELLGRSTDLECGNASVYERGPACLKPEAPDLVRNIKKPMNCGTDEPQSAGRCGWWIEIGVEPLTEALREAMKLTDEKRQAMGENGRALVERKYMWGAIADRMKIAYDDTLRFG